EPEVKLSVEKDVPWGVVVGGNFNLASLVGEGGRTLERAHSLTVGHALGEAWSGFVETYSQRIDRAHGYATAVDAGVTHPVGRHAQVDAYVGRTVRGARAEWFIGVGFSVQQSLLPMLRR
ncbi:MAG: transporter, partial [Acidobacteriota bacterium]